MGSDDDSDMLGESGRAAKKTGVESPPANGLRCLEMRDIMTKDDLILLREH